MSKQFTIPEKIPGGFWYWRADESTMYEAFNLIVEANAKEHKATTLRAADGKLKYLRQLITIASDLQFDKNTVILPYKKQLVWCDMLIEIGKLIGSWLNKIK